MVVGILTFWESEKLMRFSKKLAAANVPGKNTIVRSARRFIAELSRCEAAANRRDDVEMSIEDCVVLFGDGIL